MPKVTTLEQIEYIERAREFQKLFVEVSENESLVDIVQATRDLEILEEIYSNLQIDYRLEQIALDYDFERAADIQLPQPEAMQC